MAPHAIDDLFGNWDDGSTFPTESLLQKKLDLKYLNYPQSTAIKTEESIHHEVLGSQRQLNECMLTITDLEEVKAAATAFEKTGLALNMINPATFPLPTLSSKLRLASEQIHGRQEHVLIRGLNSIKLTYMEKVIAHTGLTSHIAGKRAMGGIEGGDKTVLHHVTALSTAYFAEKDYKAPSNAAGSMVFHNDLGDVLSLFAVSQGQRGGSTCLSNVRDIYDELVRSYPDVIPILTDDWISESPSKVKGFDKRPVMYFCNGRVMMCCSRVRISGTSTRPRPSFLPPLSAKQVEALDIVQSLATKFAIKVRLEAGDLLAFNNLGMMHARDSFVDDEGSARKRHLLRIIAKDETKAWTLPEPLNALHNALYAHEDKDEKFDIFKNPFMFTAGH